MDNLRAKIREILDYHQINNTIEAPELLEQMLVEELEKLCE